MYWPEPDGSGVTVWADLTPSLRTNRFLLARDLQANPNLIYEVAKEIADLSSSVRGVHVFPLVVRSSDPPYREIPESWLRRFGRWLGLVRD